MTTAGRRRYVWLALMIGLRCDARCDTSWWWDYPPRDECDTLWQLSQILTHTWQMCDRSAAQKVHRGNFQGCRRIFNEIKITFIIFFSNCSKWLSTLVSLSRQSLSLWKYSWPYLLQSWCLKHPPGPSQCSGDQCTLPVPQWAEDVMRWWPQVGHVAGDMLVFSLNIKNLINTLILCCCVRMDIITFICHNLAATRWQGDTILPPSVPGKCVCVMLEINWELVDTIGPIKPQDEENPFLCVSFVNSLSVTCSGDRICL